MRCRVAATAGRTAATEKLNWILLGPQNKPGSARRTYLGGRGTTGRGLLAILSRWRTTRPVVPPQPLLLRTARQMIPESRIAYHSRESGNPEFRANRLDSRVRGNDRRGHWTRRDQ